MTTPKRDKQTKPKMHTRSLPGPFIPKVRRGAPAGNQNAVGNKGGGREHTYKSEYAQIAKGMCIMGALDVDVARHLEIGLTTLYRWKSAIIEFSEAMKRGKEVADDAVEEALFKRATGYSYDTEKVFQTGVRMEVVEHIPPDTGAATFWLSRRRKEVYADTSKHERGPTAGNPFLKLLERMEEKAELERADSARVIEHVPAQSNPTLSARSSPNETT
jgi:hypothetical protein